VPEDGDKQKLQHAKSVAFGRALDQLPSDFVAAEISGKQWIYRSHEDGFAP
jgi:hypothetical protein